MANIEKDSVENSLRNYARFTTNGGSGSRKTKMKMVALTNELTFGHNQKKDNFSKTGQLKLF